MMRTKLIAFAVVVQLFILPIANAQERSVQLVLVDSNGAKKQVRLYEGSYALVIGESDYTNGWDDLRGVRDDVAIVVETLRKHGFLVEKAENLTGQEIRTRIETFIREYGYDEKNRLLVYYAGHGHTLKSAGDNRELGYIVPVDAPNPTKDVRGFRQAAVSMTLMQTYAREIQSKHALFVFDSCFSGKIFAMRENTVIPSLIADSIDNPVRQIITAGDEKQSVPDESIFRRVFVRGLEGEADQNKDGYVTGIELGYFIKDRVTSYTNRRQTPRYGTINDVNLDQGDVVFVVPSKSSLTSAEIAWNNFRGLARILLKYDVVTEFSEGLAAAMLNDKYGFIDEKDNTVIPFKYDGIQSSCGEVKFSEYDGEFSRCTGSFSGGLVAVQLNNKWGFIDKTGTTVIPFNFDAVVWFSEGLAMVRVGNKETGKWGYIDKAGKILIPIKYDEAYPFEEGLAQVKANKKWGIINKTGREVVPIKYDSIESFSEGLASVRLNNKVGFIDKTGKEVIPLKYDGPSYSGVNVFSEGLGVVYLGGRWGFIDKSGKEIIPAKYDWVSPFSEGLAHVKLNDKHGFIDKAGNEVIPLRYDAAQSFQNGLAMIELNKKDGIIDRTGKEIVPPLKYDSVWNIGANLLVIGVGDYETRKWGLMDKNGREVISPKYDSVYDKMVMKNYFIVRLRVKGKYLRAERDYWLVGLVDNNGKEVVAPKYANDFWYWGEDFLGVWLLDSEGMPKAAFVDLQGNQFFDP